MPSLLPAALAASGRGQTPDTGPSQGATVSNLTTSGAATSSDGWTTYHYDNTPDGYPASLPAISSPSASWEATVVGAVYAEPLYYGGYVYVATEDDNVYALTAATGAIAWSTNLGTPADSVEPPYACNNNQNGPDIKPTIGITGTPVIDPASGTIDAAALVSNSGYILFGST